MQHLGNEGWLVALSAVRHGSHVWGIGLENYPVEWYGLGKRGWQVRLLERQHSAYTQHEPLETQQLFGFSDMAEREMFRLLVGISGVGNQTARVMLSSLTVDELRTAIQAQDVKKVQRVKGIGAKTAQRIVLELADKMGLVGMQSPLSPKGVQANQARDEAMTALTMLGFAKPAVEKLLMSTDWKNADGSPMTVEEIIKEGLKRL